MFWIVDNGSSHRSQRSTERLQSRYNNLVLVHRPVYTSWLNQIKIYFSVVPRKALMPNDFASLEALWDRLFAFERQYEMITKPLSSASSREPIWRRC